MHDVDLILDGVDSLLSVGQVVVFEYFQGDLVIEVVDVQSQEYVGSESSSQMLYKHVVLVEYELLIQDIFHFVVF